MSEWLRLTMLLESFVSILSRHVRAFDRILRHYIEDIKQPELRSI